MSQYFSEKELACRCGCGAVGMKPIFLDMLDALRLAYNRPIILNSAFRCEKKNREVGGAPDSQHLLGLAADIACADSAERFLLVKLAFSLGFRGIEVGADWVHVDFRAGLERMFLK